MDGKNGNTSKTHRPLMFVVLGLFLLVAAAFLINDRLKVHTSIAPKPEAYSYSVQQNAGGSVHYMQNSFYNGPPGPINTAYIAGLTDYIDAQFHYNYRANQTATLTYKYDAEAVVRGTYGSESTDEGLSNVWTKKYQLLKPVSGRKTGKSLNLNPSVKIPFQEYRQTIDQFKNALNVPVNTELVVTYTVRVSGKANGTPFENVKTSKISAPLDQQIYKLGVKFAKNDHKDVLPAETLKLEDIITRYEIPVAIALIVIGLAYTVYGFRRQIIKTPYQRKLERIFRYHDGIIIRAERPASMENKDVVTVKSFDDLLNLEEEIKTPIVASQVSDSTTHFFIARDDVVYVYTLGVPVPFRPTSTNASGEQARKRNAPKHKVMP